MENKEKFLRAIDKKLKVKITFNSIEKGVITRTCIPFDFGPSQKKDAIDKTEKYHMYDLDSPDNGQHNLSVTPEQLLDIVVLDEEFNPADYVIWDPPYKWIYPRDWGDKS